MDKSESIKEISAALAAFQGELINPPNSKTVSVKTKTGGNYSYKYAPLDEILKLARPLLAKNGLSIVQAPYSTGAEISIATSIYHSSGEWIECPPLTLKAADLSPQAIGSAITYGRRYSLSAALGISSEDDDDGEAAGIEQPSKRQQPENLICTGCGTGITQAVKTFSEKNHGRALCKDCQGKEKK